MIEHCFKSIRITGSLPLRNSLQALEKSFLQPLTVRQNIIYLSPSLTCNHSTSIFQVSAVQARSVSANMKTMRNGQLTFLSNSVTVRNYSFLQRIDSQAEYVNFVFPIYQTSDLIDHLDIAFVKLYAFFFSIGTIPDNDSISYEFDRRSPCTLFPRGRDQSGTGFLPYFHEQPTAYTYLI